MAMNTGERDFFEQNGYLIVRQAVTGGELRQLTSELLDYQSAIESGRYRGNHLFENEQLARVAFNPYDFCPALRQLVGRKDMLGRARGILGSGVRLDHSKLMCKPAGSGTPQPPHQDYYYWQGSKSNQVAVFVCIDPSTEANGCLRVYPGSHKNGLLEHREEHHQLTGERHWVCKVTPEIEGTETTFIGEPGDAIFFGSLTVHRSDGNGSDRHRRAVIFEYDEKGNLPPRPGWGTPIPAAEWD